MTKLKKSVLSAFATLILAGVFGAPLPTGCGPLGGGTGISTNQRLVNMECAIMKVYNWCSLSQADCEWLLLSRQRCWYSDHCDKFSLANARFFPSLRRYTVDFDLILNLEALSPSSVIYTVQLLRTNQDSSVFNATPLASAKLTATTRVSSLIYRSKAAY